MQANEYPCVRPEGRGREVDALRALRLIEWINIQDDKLRLHGVLLHVASDPDYQNFACGYTPVCVEVDRLVNSGVVVVAPAGNDGFDNSRRRSVEVSMTDPGNASRAITVGATHSSQPMVYGASAFSARGPPPKGVRSLTWPDDKSCPIRDRVMPRFLAIWVCVLPPEMSSPSASRLSRHSSAMYPW